uniref:Variable lymphocyte receptor C n=1 Tax=Geotria australis TaxID=71168 RepID=A0A8K1T0R5_9VERT|nr:variable lymphocyte receptor C [Geotria australis]
MGLLVALFILLTCCQSSAVPQACGANGVEGVCTCTLKDDVKEIGTVDCSSKKLNAVPTGIPPSTENPWDCTCASISYLAKWLKKHPELDNGASCETNTAVKDVVIENIEDVPCKHSYPTATPIQQMNATTSNNLMASTVNHLDVAISEQHRVRADLCSLPFISHMCVLFCSTISTCSLCFIIKPLRRYRVPT